LSAAESTPPEVVDAELVLVGDTADPTPAVLLELQLATSAAPAIDATANVSGFLIETSAFV
jgi:hypothetical protein